MRGTACDFSAELGSFSTAHPEYEQQVKSKDEYQDQDPDCNDQCNTRAEKGCDSDDRCREQDEDDDLDPDGQIRERLEKIS